MNADRSTFVLEIENTSGLCPVGERYGQQQMRERRTPVLCCEGPCIRGEIARQVANRIGKEAPFARACQGEAVVVPHSAIARWVREAEQVVVVDGCFLRCQARTMRGMLRPGQIVEIDTLPFYGKYTDLFEIDSVPEAERNAVAEEVARHVIPQLARLADAADIKSPAGQV